MISVNHSRVMSSAAIVLGWIWLTAGPCGDSTAPNPIQGCSVNYDTGWPLGATFSLDLPASCPVATTGAISIPYSANGDFPAGSVTYGFYQNSTVTWNGYTGSMAVNPAWSQGNGRYMVDVSADYFIATGGFDQNSSGYDDIKNLFMNPQGQWVGATTRITYQFGNYSGSIDAPSTVDPNTNYTMNASTNDPLLRNPVSWTWYLNGSYYTTTDTPQLSVDANGPLTYQSWTVQVSDGNGNSASSSEYTVWTSSGCGNVDQC